jgi:hypothetical protein
MTINIWGIRHYYEDHEMKDELSDLERTAPFLIFRSKEDAEYACKKISESSDYKWSPYIMDVLNENGNSIIFD